MLEFAPPFFAWEWRGRLYIGCGFGGRLDSGLSRLRKTVSVRIVDMLDVGQSPRISPVDVIPSLNLSIK
jgi:hypothetical protein